MFFTELLTPSSFNIHVLISEKVRDERRAKAKAGSNVETIQTLVGLAEKFLTAETGASSYHANFTHVEDYDYADDMNEPADPDQTHNDLVSPVLNEMWFLTIDPFIGILVFIAKLSERQYC